MALLFERPMHPYEMVSLMRERVSEPVKEYTQFAAGLSFIPALPPTEAMKLLERRVRLLEKEVEKMRSDMDAAMERGVTQLFLIEHEHELVLREAELRWVRELVCEIEDGTLGGMREWESFHSQPVELGVEET